MKNLLNPALIILLFTSLILDANAQDEQLIRAEYDFANNKYAEAFESYKSAASIYHQHNQMKEYVHCNIKMTQCKINEGKTELGLTHALRTWDFINEVTPYDTNSRITTLGQISQCYLFNGRNDLALEYLTKQEQLVKNKVDIKAAECFNNLGIAYWNNDNRAIALSYHEASLKIKKQIEGIPQESIADSYNNIGLLYLGEDALQAQIYFEQAAKIYEEAKNDEKLLNVYSNIALALSEKAKYPEAIQYQDLVIAMWNEKQTGDHPNKAFALSAKASILQVQGKLNESLHLQEQALHQYLKTLGNKHPEVANTYARIAAIYEAKHEYKLAVEQYQNSIYANTFSQDWVDLLDLPELKEYYNADILLSSLMGKARALELLHFQNSMNPQHLKAVISTYLLCDDLISTIRQLRLTEKDKLRLAENSTHVYEKAIEIALYLGEHSWTRNKYFNQAFEFAERSKSAILLEAISETHAKSYAGIPAELLIKEDSIKEEISYWKHQVASAPSEISKRNLFEYEQALRQHIEMLENDFPEYFELKFSNHFASVDDVQAILQPTEAILSYFTGTTNIYIFCITKNNISIASKPKPEDFEQSINGFRNSIKYKVAKVFAEKSESLYNLLIPKTAKTIQSLTIIPDGILGVIPFETLIDETPKDINDYGSYNFLVKKYAIAYDYGASLLVSRQKNKAASVKTAEKMLLVAPVSFQNQKDRLSNLPGTEKEVKEIRYLFIASDIKPEIKLEQQATESILKSGQLTDYKYIHLATHGVVNQSKPELSKIYLSEDDENDGSLYNGEIYNLKVNADLITLSACETGLGKVAKGEGIVGLSRSLMYAGAKNMILSLWTVSDQSTSDLMISFYQHHLKHPSEIRFTDDLREAKLQLIANEQYSEPYFWAPFILIGQ